jgi:type II secretory pathway pseudopilin PulG
MTWDARFAIGKSRGLLGLARHFQWVPTRWQSAGGFPFPFGRGEGQGEGFAAIRTSAVAPGQSLCPLTPALSPSEGERENPAPSMLQSGSSAFSLIEILIAVTLMSVIMVGLMAMFSQTQAAFRASMTQVDVLESGRAAADLLSRELEQVAPSYYGDAINFYANAKAGPVPQQLPGIGSYPRANVIEDFFFLTRENQNWIGMGYCVEPRGAPLGALYRFTGTINVNQDPAPLLGSFAKAISTPPAGMSRFMDGVVHFKIRAFDANGAWITPANFPAYASSLPNMTGESGYRFTSNAVPAFVEFEIGILEDRTLERYKSFTDPTGIIQSNYLAKHAGQVHLFRRRVPVRNVDPLAYLLPHP